MANTYLDLAARIEASADMPDNKKAWAVELLTEIDFQEQEGITITLRQAERLEKLVKGYTY